MWPGIPNFQQVPRRHRWCWSEDYNFSSRVLRNRPVGNTRDNSIRRPCGPWPGRSEAREGLLHFTSPAPIFCFFNPKAKRGPVEVAGPLVVFWFSDS